MTQTLEYAGTLTVVTCWCGIRHAVPSELYEFMERQHANGQKQRGITCPLGHSWAIAGEGEAEKLRKQLDREHTRLAATRDLLRAEERSHTATRGHLTRQRKRVQAGVCPCCGRTFKQLAAHMKTKHPEFVPEELPAT